MAETILGAMRTLGERHGLTHLVAPVRPSWKEKYPITPIEEYVTWRRDDGQLLDPWMRVHERLGARVATPLPRVDADHGDGRGVGGVDGHGVPGLRATTSSPRASTSCTSTARRTVRRTGSPISGWCTLTCLPRVSG